MLHMIIFYLHYIILLLFGTCLSFLFAKISFNKKNIRIFIDLCLVCGLSQLIAYLLFREQMVWQFYPLLSHLPIVIVLCFYYKRRFITALAAVTSAYLCCQPSNFAGIVVLDLTNIATLEYIVRILFFIGTGYLIYKFIASSISELFIQNDHPLNTFAFLPVAYYIYDYSIGIYTEFWYANNSMARELLPLLLFLVFLFTCSSYYQEYALREYAERKESIVQTTSIQQKKEIDSLKAGNKEISLIRHDMRHILASIAMHIENDEKEKALEIISEFTSHINVTSVKRFCDNETLNYVMSAFDSRCAKLNVILNHKLEVGPTSLDEILLTSVVSNALENALNAQKELPQDQRFIKIMIRQNNGRLLISVKNPYYTEPTLIDGIPISKRKGHGYGTKSILYTTEKLGGNCQFMVKDGIFILRIIL